MNLSKPTPPAMLIAILATAPLAAQVELTDNAAISGFVNGVYTHTDDGNGSTEDLKLDQAEIDLIFNLDTVSGEIHLQTDGTNNVELEQAFATLDVGNGISISAGRFLSMLGFESDERVNRFTHSYAYDLSNPIPLYNDGVNVKAVTDLGWLSLSLLDEVWDGYGPGNVDDGAMGVEIQAGFTTQQGLTAVVGYGGQDTGDKGLNPSAEILNVWVSYETGAFIFAAEYNDFSYASNVKVSNPLYRKNGSPTGALTGDVNKGDAYLLLAHYAANNNLSVTARFAEEDLDTGDESKKWTISPKYSFTDNFAGRLEYSRTDLEKSGTEEEVDFFSVEAIFTF
jgi:hypothetical protein